MQVSWISYQQSPLSPLNNSNYSPSPQTFRTVEVMYAHERENWGVGGRI